MKLYIDRKKNCLAIIALLIFINISHLAISQTSVFYYDNQSKAYPNNQIVRILEASNKDLYLLGKISDSKYQVNKPSLIRLDKKGNFLKRKILPAKYLNNLNGMILLPSQDIKIFGSCKNNDKYYPYESTVTPDGTVRTKEAGFSVFSTWLNDVRSIDEEHALVVETKKVKTGKFNISVYKINTKNNEQEWFKKISSEDNEEADKILVLRNNNIVILGKKYTDDLTSYVPIIYKLTPEGRQIWKKGIDVPRNFYSQSICVNRRGVLYYICGYTKETTGLCETRIITLSSENKELRHKTFRNISANGILSITNSSFIIYGSNVLVKNNRVVTKAKYIVFDDELNVLSQKQLGQKDVPDSEFSKKKFYISPTNSDLITALKLSDGRIACAGKIYMPNMRNIKNSPKRNNALLLLIKKNW
ncbi:MAG: hypothetical protein DRJ01_08795 [Bacteroidetes bacterium]|nr:MAG: hypothetical protein DRJ01_08795 [Bacteroidota bacterium]